MRKFAIGLILAVAIAGIIGARLAPQSDTHRVATNQRSEEIRQLKIVYDTMLQAAANHDDATFRLQSDEFMKLSSALSLESFGIHGVVSRSDEKQFEARRGECYRAALNFKNHAQTLTRTDSPPLIPPKQLTNCLTSDNELSVE